MPHYKDPENKLHFLNDANFTHLLPDSCIEITEDEAATLQASKQLTGNSLTLRKIAELEATVTDRRIREAVLGIDNGWLAGVNDQIAALRKSLA